MNFLLSGLSGSSPVLLAFIATLFTWFVTLLGSAVVFFKKDMSRKVLDASLGFAAGIMISASFWSLLLPSVEMARGMQGIPVWFPPVLGFVVGGVFLRLIDFLTPHLHLFLPEEKKEGVIRAGLKKTTLLILAITIHNFPEGLAVGVAFGAVGKGNEEALLGAFALALGIGIQNFPEGMAVSLPLRREGLSPLKSFFFGQLSAVVEPLGGILGAWLVSVFHYLLPYALSFAAGAMIFVVVEELVPESQAGDHSDIATMGVILGFALMMLLDVAFS